LVCGGDGTVGWVLDALDKVDLPVSLYILCEFHVFIHK